MHPMSTLIFTTGGFGKISQIFFLDTPDYFPLGFLWNVDWFQPYENSPYSVGVIYLVIQNLPREERFKEENMMVLGIIPGPKEPKVHINSYISPIVDELLRY